MTESTIHKELKDVIANHYGDKAQKEAYDGKGRRVDVQIKQKDDDVLNIEIVKSHCPDRDGLIVDLKESRLRAPVNQNSRLISDVLRHLKNNGIELEEGKYINTFTLKHAIADVRSSKPKKISEWIKSLLDGHYIKESGFVCEVLKI